MPRDDVGILRCGETDLKGIGRSSLRGITNRMSAMLLSFSFFHFD
jgi:hypothetical protein